MRGLWNLGKAKEASTHLKLGKMKPGELFLKILFIYLAEIETASERGNTSRGSGRGRSRLIMEEPDVVLNPIAPGSRPEPKADAQPLCHPGAPQLLIFKNTY